MENKKKEGTYEYASAPYNFIPFPKKVVYRYKKINELPVHNKIDSKLNSGYIEYKVTTKSPLFIGDGKGNFFNIKEAYTIPGSTIRGKVRSNAEILSFSYPEFIEDTRLWFRGAFARDEDVLKELYNNIIGIKANRNIEDIVKAGYLIKEKDGYKIIPAKRDANNRYFRGINEGTLLAMCNKIDKGFDFIRFMYDTTNVNLWNEIYSLKSERNKHKKDRDEIKDEDDVRIKKIDDKIKEIDAKIKEKLCASAIKDYIPYFCNVKYRVDLKGRISIISARKFQSRNIEGTLMSSNRVNGSDKQCHYLIYEKDTNVNKIKVKDEVKTRFETSVRLINNVKKYFHLPKYDNEAIPVFYMLDDKENEVTSFGFTPYLKVAYDKTVLNGVKIQQEEGEMQKLDYAQSIFGFTKVKKSYKGRVSFTNAKLSNKAETMSQVNKFLMSPKISSFQLYLKQEDIKENFSGDKEELKAYMKNLKAYSGDFELRGQKFYWLRKETDNSSYNTKNNNQTAKLVPIKVNAEFEGKIYFENLTDDELGLICKAIKPFEGALDNLGQGKPYGFGKCKFDILNIKLLDYKNRFAKFALNQDKVMNEKAYVQAFHEKMKLLSGEGYAKTQTYEAFMLSKNPNEIPEESELKYMNFKNEIKKGGKYYNRNILKPIEKYTEELKARSGEIDLSALKEKFKVTSNRHN